MNILEINTEKTWRGGERQTLYTVEGLAEKGINVFLLCMKNSLLSQKSIQSRSKLIEINFQFAVFFHLLFNARKYDVIHVQNSKALVWVVLAKWFHATPVVYTRRVDFVPKGFLTLWKYRQLDKVVAISEAIKNILLKQGIQDIVIIPSMVKYKNFNKGFAEKVLHQLGCSNKKIIATTAAFVEHKDPQTLVNAIAELKKLRNDFVFLHFGEGQLMHQIKSEVEKLNLQNEYIFMGFRDDAEDFFSVMNVFVMSSQEEGLGSSVLDAFQYNVPVASTDAGGLKETVEGCGLVSAVKDYKALAINISRLLDDADLVKSLTHNAKQRVLEKYAVQKNTDSYLKLFSQLTSS
ncbi:MAG: Glycosyltransferase Gtf1 [Bacteroidia bacterium]|nr:Glycosyltransferase Gtf1 [Bacteroidia bacterium]